MTAAPEDADPLTGIGWDDRWADLAVDEAAAAVMTASDDPADPGPGPGRITRTHRVGFDVLTSTGVCFAIHRARSRDPLTAPATGDWVVVERVEDVEEPVISAVLPRRTALIRRDPADRVAPQVLAANVDVVALCHGADRPVNPRKLERQLALAHGSGADVVVVVTKSDLDPDGRTTEAVARAAPMQEILVTGVRTGEGVAVLDACTDGNRTLALVGESGAGKSSLVNAVVGHEALATGGVRESDAKGRHTTTRRTLIPLPTGGGILDTPGVRAIGLWPDWADLDEVFVEIAEAALDCRFRDCRHAGEPGCAVTAAAEAGLISDERWEAYRRLGEELEATRREVEQKGWR